MQNEHTQTVIEFTSEYAVFEIPEHTLTIDMDIKVFDDGKIVECTRSYSMDEVRDAILEARENYIDQNETYVLTEKGREYLRELEEKYGEDPTTI